MAKRDVVRKILPDAIDQNEAILWGLRSRNKVDNKSLDDLNKLFNTLNTKVAAIIEKNKGSPTSLSHSVKNLRYGSISSCPVGSWWGVRVDCSRSFVHCPFLEDVHDGIFGAASICVTHSNTNVDADHGDLLTFTGREYDEDATNPREPLILNYRYRIPLRVVRSCSLTNKYAPKTGIRYDGLYYVVTHWIGIYNESKKRHKFALIRLANQDPPPWETNTTITPQTVEQLTPVLEKLDNKRNNKRTRKSKVTDSVFQNEKHMTRSKLAKKDTSSEPVKKPVTSRLPSSNIRALAQNKFRLKLRHAETPNTNVSIRTDLYNIVTRNSKNLDQSKSNGVKMLTRFKAKSPEPIKNGLIQRMNPIENKSKNITEKVTIPIDDRMNSRLKPIDSGITNPVNVTPDTLLDLIVQKKSHPMAQLLIQNMIGVQKTNVNKAYESLNRTETDREPKQRTNIKKLFNYETFLRSRRRLRSQAIRSNFDTRKLRDRKVKSTDLSRKSKEQRKNCSREQSNAPSNEKSEVLKLRNRRNLDTNEQKPYKQLRSMTKVEKIIKSTKKKEEPQSSVKKRVVSVGTQCTLLISPSVDCSSQTDMENQLNCHIANLEEIKSESEEESETEEESEENTDDEEGEEEEQEEEMVYEPQRNYYNLQRAQIVPSNSYVPSAFAPVLKIGNGIRIERLRSIGFRPIIENIVRKDVNEEYNKYIAEENEIVGYMDEELHYEDIENEDRRETIKLGPKYAQFRKHHSIKPVQSTSKMDAVKDLFQKDVHWGNKLIWTRW